MSRALQQELLSRIDTAATILDLPLTRAHIEALTVELTPAIRALLAERDALIGELEPVPYEVPGDGDTGGDAEGQESETTEFAGCTSRIGLDVGLDSRAAVLAERLRSSQPDVIATDVPDAATLGVTVRPQSIDCWRWWLHRLNVAPNSLRTDGDAVTATGSLKGVRINVRGDGVPGLLAEDQGAARLAGIPAGHPW